MAKELEVRIPDIGDFDSVPVIDVLVKTGDRVEKEAPLVTLESDKATMDVPAPEAGIVKSVKLKVGDKVKQGDAVLMLELAGEAEAVPAAESAALKSSSAETAAPKAEDKPAEQKSAEAKAPAPAKEAAPEKKASAKPAARGKLEVSVPDIGDFHDVPIIEVMVKDGDAVEKDATLLTLESDKATLDVPAPAAGTVRNLKLKVGDKVSKGSAVCTLETATAEAESKDEAAPAASKSEAQAAPKSDKSEASESRAPGNLGTAPEAVPASPPQPDAQKDVANSADKKAGEVPHASPSIRKFARELGVDLGLVKGSGPKARITLEDVQGYVKKTLAAPPPPAKTASTGSGIPPMPAIDFSQFGAIENKPLARIRKLSATYLHRAWLNVPHVTQTDEADITDLEAFRKAQNAEALTKLTLLPFILKACAKSMAAYPEFSASLAPDGESLILKKYTHIGFAADTPNGLVVPVVRDVDRKGIVALASETAELAKKARDGKLKGEEMKGGCFSVSSLGGIGGSHFTPIVNAPEVAILGVSRSTIKPVWDGKSFQPRLMVPLSLSYDHRVIDGAYAARFIVHLVQQLADLRRLIL